LRYWCDTEPGSSGSPIVRTLGDKQRHVVGLHARGNDQKEYNYGYTWTAIIDDINENPPKYGVLYYSVYDR